MLSSENGPFSSFNSSRLVGVGWGGVGWGGVGWGGVGWGGMGWDGMGRVG